MYRAFCFPAREELEPPSTASKPAALSAGVFPAEVIGPVGPPGLAARALNLDPPCGLRFGFEFSKTNRIVLTPIAGAAPVRTEAKVLLVDTASIADAEITFAEVGVDENNVILFICSVSLFDDKATWNGVDLAGHGSHLLASINSRDGRAVGRGRKELRRCGHGPSPVGAALEGTCPLIDENRSISRMQRTSRPEEGKQHR